MNHLRTSPGAPTTACGLDFRTQGMLFWTIHKAAVTCPECKGTEQYARAVQRLPEVKGGPYRG